MNFLPRTMPSKCSADWWNHATANSLTKAAARVILGWTFGEEDRTRMNELAQKNQAGELTTDEQAELRSYLRVGSLLDLLHSKARLSL